MVALNQLLAEGANAVVRVVVRQATDSITSALPSSSVTSASASPIASSTGLPASPTISSAVAPTLSASASPSPSPDPNQGQNNNSPLLFFVALGFGVVFTNLWIIVGVKYCFRYNARNRQLRGLDENGEPINMENMPQRPHRRRREKKLMTMDEVNEKFPMTKYKTWVSNRAREGLPTAGGVSVQPSRANSVHSVQGVVPELTIKERESMDARPETAATAAKADDKTTDSNTPGTDSQKENTSGSGDATHNNALTSTQTIASIDPKDVDRHGSDDEDDEHINAALPPEMLEGPGDTCAICIDTLEDDDDVRGLTCGHAFHAVCLDPWLTNRRACCPLCKADYYTPKPRPPPAEGDAATPAPELLDPARNNARMNMPRNPTRSFNPWSRRNGSRNATGSTPGGFRTTRNGGVNNQHADNGQSNRHTSRRQEATATAEANSGQGGMFSRLRAPQLSLPRFGRNRNGANSATPEGTDSGANGETQATPSQLEAGLRPAATTGAN